MPRCVQSACGRNLGTCHTPAPARSRSRSPSSAKLRQARTEAAALGADLVVYPELFITGYPPEDLVRKPAFAAAARAAVEALAPETGDGGPGVIVGTVWAEAGKLYNSIALLDGGRIEAVRHKVDLPNYGVFDEKRVFDQGP